jgi:FSR family fosmidomycin resistance protein-like MFS transporter
MVGWFTDRKARPYSLAIGMGSTLIGLLLLSRSSSYPLILVSASLVGVGSSIFHPEASRMAKIASGGRPGLAQSVFQVGGNVGSSLGPLLAVLIVDPRGQSSIAWFSVIALIAILLLQRLGSWYSGVLVSGSSRAVKSATLFHPALPRKKIYWSLVVLLILVFSKYVYLTSLTSYYTLYLMSHFGVSVAHSQLCLFVFLFAVAAGTIIGGPIGDRFGRKYVIWISILGVAPFTLVLPHVGLTATIVLTVFIGVILASAFSAIVVYAQELVPGKVGTMAGLFFGLAFGFAGIGSTVLGVLADHTSIENVYEICGYLPLLGVLTAFLPNLTALDERPA